MDNDPPFPPLADFVATWNRLELKPTLRLTTAAVAMKRLEEEIGAQVPEYQGEWPDWWAFGTASAPREVAASRIAKRLLEAAESPLWGPWNAAAAAPWTNCSGTSASSTSIPGVRPTASRLPYSLDTQGQFNEKAALAFRPMARAQWLLGQRVRSRLAGEAEGLVRGQQCAAAVERLDADATHRFERGLPFAGRPEVGRPDEDVLRERFRPFTGRPRMPAN